MSSPITISQWPTMCEPRPIRLRLPMDTTGSVGITCPGAMPAEMEAPGPTIVSAPMWIRCSL